ncbi:RHS repeat-associated core domain-containing protein [Verrucomicrobiota bacterium sgz303538]
MNHPSSQFLARFADRTRLMVWLVLWSFLTTGSVPTLYAGTPRAIELRVAPGRIAHQFGIRSNPPTSPQEPLQAVNSNALVTDNSAIGGYTSLSTIWDTDKPFTISDLTAGEVLASGALGSSSSAYDKRNEPWSGVNGSQKQYFLLPQERATSHLYLAQPGGVWYPLTAAPSLYTGSDGVVFREAFSPYSSGSEFWLEDYLRNERSPSGKTNLLDATWSSILNPPLYTVTFYLEGVHLGQSFSFHSRSEGGGVRSVTVQATLANNGASFWTRNASGSWVEMPAGTVQVTGTVGARMAFWLSRVDLSEIESANYLTPGPGSGITSYPVFGVFPTPGHSMEWMSFTYRANNGSYVVQHQGGYSAPIYEGFTGWMYSYDDSGSQIDSIEYGYGGAWVDTSVPWNVQRSDGTTYSQYQADLLEWYQYGSPSPTPIPAPSNETLTIYRGRSDHQFSIRQYDDSGAEIIVFTFLPQQMGYGGWTPFDFWNGYEYVYVPFGGYSEYTEEWMDEVSGVSCSIPVFTITVPCYTDRPFTLVDDTTGEVATGNFNHWFEAPSTKEFQISTSRAGHALYLERLTGTSEKIQEHQTQGNFSLSDDGGVTFNSYYYFDASAPHWDFIPFRIVDTDTGERTSWNPTNDDLVRWISLPAITDLTGQVTNANAVELNWPLAQASRDGAFLVERRIGEDISAPWFQIANMPAALAQGNPLALKYTDRLAAPGQNNRYRIRYSYGGQTSGASNIVAVATNSLPETSVSSPDEDNPNSLSIKSPHSTVPAFMNPLKGMSAKNVGDVPNPANSGGGAIPAFSGSAALHSGLMQVDTLGGAMPSGLYQEWGFEPPHQVNHSVGKLDDNCVHSRYHVRLKFDRPPNVGLSAIKVQERKGENGEWIDVPGSQLAEREDVVDPSDPLVKRKYLVMDRIVDAGDRYFYRLKSGVGANTAYSTERYVEVGSSPQLDLRREKIPDTRNQEREVASRFIYPQTDGDPQENGTFLSDRCVYDYLVVAFDGWVDTPEAQAGKYIRAISPGNVRLGYKNKEYDRYETDWEQPSLTATSSLGGGAKVLISGCVLYGIDSRATDVSDEMGFKGALLKSRRTKRVLQLYPVDSGATAIAQAVFERGINYLKLCKGFSLNYDPSQIKVYRNGKFLAPNQMVEFADFTSAPFENLKVVPVSMEDGASTYIRLNVIMTKREDDKDVEVVDWDELEVRYSARYQDGSMSNTDRIPIDEASGARYRKVALNGRPLSDDPPQASGESDHSEEETYIDAMTLQVRHSTTDVWAPVPGSDLSLSVRRNLQTEIWNLANGLRPDTRAYHAFGACWSSNLDAHLRIEIPMESLGSAHTIDAYVTDSDGSVHKFMAVAPRDRKFIAVQPMEFLAVPTGIHEHASHLTSLKLTDKNNGRWTFRGPFGTEMSFELCGTTMVGSGGGGAPTFYVYARPVRVTDRLGNTLIYEYNTSGGILRPLPRKIYLAADPSRAIQIQCDSSNYVTDIWDPNGNQWHYNYYQHGEIQSADGLATATALKEVIGPDTGLSDRKKASYNYELVTEADNRPRGNFRTDPPIANHHLNLKTLTNGRSHSYSFEYAWDRSKYSPSCASPVAGESLQFGSPRIIKTVVLPDGAGSASFSQPGDPVHLALAYTPNAVWTGTQSLGAFVQTIVGERITRVVDAENNTVDFTFFDPEVTQETGMYLFDQNGTWAMETSQTGGGPRMVAYRQMKVKSSLLANAETFEFSPQAGMALNKVTDLNGHTTEYTYGDATPPRARAFGYNWVLGDDGQFWAITTQNFTRYSRPTLEERNPKVGTSGPSAWTTFKYLIRDQPGADVPLHLLQRITSPEGRVTEYHFDSVGRRYREVAGRTTTPGTEPPDWNNASDDVVRGEQVTKFAYTNPNFPGVVTSKTVLRQANDPAWAQNLVTTFQYDSHGNVRSETTGGLTTWYAYDVVGNKLSVTNPQGHRTSFSYNSRNQLVEVGYPYDPATEGQVPPGATSPVRKTFTYDPAGNKETETDERGFTTTYVYDGLNRLIEEYRPSRYVNSVLQYAQTSRLYNKVGSLTWTKDPRGLETKFEYDGVQRLTNVTVGWNLAANLQRKTIHDYAGTNSGGSIFSSFKPTTITDPRGYKKIITYDSLYRVTEEKAQYRRVGEEPGLGEAWATTSRSYDGDGNLRAETDAATCTTTFEYDRLNRVRKKIFADQTFTTTDYTGTGLAWRATDEMRRATFTEYDALARPVKIITPPVPTESTATPPPAPVPVVTRMEYDLSGNLARKIDGLGRTWQYFYNPRKLKVAEVHPAVSIMENGRELLDQPVLWWEYDKAGNVTASTDASGYTTTTRYTPSNRPDQVTAPWVRERQQSGQILWKQPVTLTEYDFNGNVEKVTDANGNATINSYDLFNQLSSTKANNITTSYGYDKAGNRTIVTDGKFQTTQFFYDGLNRNTRIAYPIGSQLLFQYNGVDKVVRLDGKSKTTYSYDARHRLDKVFYSTSALAAYDYDYNPVGQLTKVQEPRRGTAGSAFTVEYKYDALGRVIEELSQGARHRYFYDAVGQQRAIIYGGTNRYVSKSYDALGRLTNLKEQPSVTNSSGARVTTFRPDLNGNVVWQKQPNNEEIVRHYDGLGRVELIESKSGSRLIAHTEQFYDLTGNLRRMEERHGPGSGVPDRNLDLEYDNGYRLLTEIARNPVTGQPIAATGYTYDNAGNRDSYADLLPFLLSNGVTSYVPRASTYNTHNQLTSWEDSYGYPHYLAYDANGNRTEFEKTSDEIIHYGYDEENRLVEVGSMDLYTGELLIEHRYSYDYRGRRIVREENGVQTRVIFSGGVSCREEIGASGSASTSVEYLRGPDMGGGVGGLLYTLRPGNTVRFNHYNTRGDVIAQTDGTTTVKWAGNYEAFGTHSDGTIGGNIDRQRANTKEEDPTGLLNEGLRYRDLATGVFLTRDPAGFVDGPNLYSYVRQNPWSKFDPEGLWGIVFGDTYVGTGGVRSADDWDRATNWTANSSNFREGVSAIRNRPGEVLTGAVSEQRDTPAERVGNDVATVMGTVVEVGSLLSGRPARPGGRGPRFASATGGSSAATSAGAAVEPFPLAVFNQNNASQSPEKGASEQSTESQAEVEATKPNLNSNDATSRFGIYEIETPRGLEKVGKADLNRVTKSSGLPTRLHQQLRKLLRIFGKGNVRGRVVEDLGVTTTSAAKAAENARIKRIVDKTGKIPPGNEKSYRP